MATTRSLSLAVFCIAVGPALAAGPPGSPFGRPLQVALVSGQVIAGEKDYIDPWGGIHFWTAPVTAPVRARRAIVCEPSSGLPAHWAVAHGGLWFGHSYAMFGYGVMWEQASEGLAWYDLPAMLNGVRKRTPEPQAGVVLQSFSGRTPASRVRALWLVARFQQEQYYDTLPLGRFSARQFILTNVRGRVLAVAKTNGLEASKLDATSEEQCNPRWTLTVYGFKGAWDSKAKRWAPGRWTKDETIAVGFKEDFRVLAKGDDYYFLTSSGALYRAPKPARGTHRKMERLWVNRSDPITAFITDVDGGKTFLFRDRGKKPAGFQLDKAVRAKEYGPKLFKPGKAGPEWSCAEITVGLAVVKSLTTVRGRSERTLLIVMRRPLLAWTNPS